ncbi:T9SS type A sorting domain-containing protein [Flavobacteriaceae bacterium TK19130]|nr:T9SS type A sorting domain-containing protein [Thermobacterium salinum]
MATIITSILLLFFNPFAFSQPEIAWEATFGGTENEFLHNGQATSDGGYILVGHTLSNDGDVFGNHGEEDVWVVKVDATGTLEWQRAYGGSDQELGRAILQTVDGGYIFAGSTSSEDGDVAGNNGSLDYWVVKIDAVGTIEWENAYGGSGNDRGRLLLQTNDGGFLVGGYSSSVNGDISSNNGVNDFWIVKIDSNGALQWEHSYGGSDSEYPYKAIQTADNGFIIVGDTESNDGDISLNQGEKDIWVIKTDATGNLEWQKTFGGSESETGFDVLELPDGGYRIIGDSESADGDISNPKGFYDIWMLKLDANGTLLSEKSYGGNSNESASTLLLTDDGYIISGFSLSSTGDVSNNYGNNDVWVLKINEGEEIEWEKNYGGTHSDTAQAMTFGSDGNLTFFAQTFSEDIDVSENQGERDYWIVKLEEILSNNSVEIFNVKVYPNPASDVLFIEASIPIATLQLLNVLGQTVHSASKTSQLDVSGVSKGGYFLRIRFEDGASATQKIIIQ